LKIFWQRQISLYGYFQTNAAGGFNDVTFKDDLKPDIYKMYFGTHAPYSFPPPFGLRLRKSLKKEKELLLAGGT
jgi:hypothetical protein